MRVCWQDGDEANGVAHAPAPDHLPRDDGELPDVGFRSGGDRPVDDLLGDASADCHLELREQVLERVGHLVVVGRGQGDAQRHSPGNDRDLSHRIGAGREHADEGVSRFVVGSPFPIHRRQDDPARRSEQDFLERIGEVRPLDAFMLAPSGE